MSRKANCTRSLPDIVSELYVSEFPIRIHIRLSCLVTRFWFAFFERYRMCPFLRYIFPTSQRLTGSMPMHPLPAFLNNGVPVALSSDDPGIFGHMGLSFDYFQVCPSPPTSNWL